MRDPKRIPEMLEAIRDVWEAHPDLRLGQLIMIALGTHKPMPTRKHFKMIKNKTGIKISTQILLDINHNCIIAPICSGDIFGVEDNDLLLQIRKTKVRLE